MAKRGNNYKQTKNGCSISFDTRGSIDIKCDDKHVHTVYSSIKLERYEGELAIHITIDKKNNIWILNRDQCIIECKKGGKTMLLGCSNAKAYTELKDILRIKPIIIRR